MQNLNTIKTAEDLKNLPMNDDWLKIDKSDKYSIRKDGSKCYAISDGDFYTGEILFIKNKWRVHASFFDIDYEEDFKSLQLALDFIIEKARTDLIRIIF